MRRTSVDLTELGEIVERHKTGKSNKKKVVHSDAEELDKLFRNTSLIVAKDGTILLQPANCGAEYKRKRLLIPATEEAVDKMAEGLKKLLNNKEVLSAKFENFYEWVNSKL